MIYQITVPKIHCTGCVSLIKMSLEEVFGEETVSVDQMSKTAEFRTDKNLDDVKVDLDKVFEELKESGYEYIDLKTKN